MNKKSSGEEIQGFFRKVVENFDEDQVYNSDILKLAAWYAVLKDVLDFENLSKPEESEGDKDATKKSTKAAPKKAVSKPAPKAQSKAKGGVKKAGNVKAG